MTHPAPPFPKVVSLYLLPLRVLSLRCRTITLFLALLLLLSLWAPPSEAAQSISDFVGGAGYQLRFSGGREIIQDEIATTDILDKTVTVKDLSSLASWQQSQCEPNPFADTVGFTIEAWMRYSEKEKGAYVCMSVLYLLTGPANACLFQLIC